MSQSLLNPPVFLKEGDEMRLNIDNLGYQEQKIISTIGPSSYKESIIRKMDNAGVDIFRINLSKTNETF